MVSLTYETILVLNRLCSVITSGVMLVGIVMEVSCYACIIIMFITVVPYSENEKGVLLGRSTLWFEK